MFHHHCIYVSKEVAMAQCNIIPSSLATMILALSGERVIPGSGVSNSSLTRNTSIGSMKSSSTMPMSITWNVITESSVTTVSTLV